jgi:hypothetical protein
MHGMAQPSMMRVRLVAAAAAIAVLLVAQAALAQSADEHGAADALVRQLDLDTAHHVVMADTLGRAKNALERATRLRAAGDEAHAKAADGLALEWAQTARDLVKAADAEGAAGELRRKALDAQAQLERSRGLVEEAIASIGRLRAELDQAEGKSREDRTAVEIHDGDKPPPPKKKAGGKKAAPAPKPGKSDAGGTP